MPQFSKPMSQTEWLRKRKLQRLWGPILLFVAAFQAIPSFPLPIPDYAFPGAYLFGILVFSVPGVILVYLGWKIPSDKVILDTIAERQVNASLLARELNVDLKSAQRLVRDLIKKGIIDLSKIAQTTQGLITAQLLMSQFRIPDTIAEQILQDGFLAGWLNIYNKVDNATDISAWVCQFVGVGGIEMTNSTIKRDTSMDLGSFTVANPDVSVSQINRALLTGGLALTDQTTEI